MFRTVPAFSIEYYRNFFHSGGDQEFFNKLNRMNSEALKTCADIYDGLFSQMIYPYALDTDLPSHHFWAVEKSSQKLLGAAVCLQSIMNGQHTLIIASIYVDETMRRRGIGNALVERIITDVIHDNKDYWIPVNSIAAYPPASSVKGRFFEHCGFKKKAGVLGYQHFEFSSDEPHCSRASLFNSAH